VQRRGRIYFQYRIQTDSGSHPASYPISTEALSPSVKGPEHETTNLPPSRAEIKNAWSYTSIPPYYSGVALR
jgi:hypothetical protein